MKIQGIGKSKSSKPTTIITPPAQNAGWGAWAQDCAILTGSSTSSHAKPQTAAPAGPSTATTPSLPPEIPTVPTVQPSLVTGTAQVLAEGYLVSGVGQTPARPRPTCAGKTREQVIRGVQHALANELHRQACFAVDEELFPSLDKLKLDPVEFFTARACWQGISTKRRAVLEGVLNQFPSLPKDQKNWQAAVAAAKQKGTPIEETDLVFIRYFMENRKAMKTLFRATLRSAFQGESAICYRGQSDDASYGRHSTKALGCYSIDPYQASKWSKGGNLKKFRVKLSDVWSTYTVSQNTHRTERELTVFSRGGLRKGDKLQDVWSEKSHFDKLYRQDLLAQALECVLSVST